ncbi:MAG: hypothetical protein V1779_12315 [bacterium]
MQTQVADLFQRVSQLPEDIQENLTFFWNEDIESEMNFDKKLYDTADKLEILAKEALYEFKTGKTIEKGFDEL